MSSATLPVKPRIAGSANARVLRRSGSLPGTLYGHGAAPLSIAVASKEFHDLLRTGAGHHLINIVIEGGASDSVLLRSVQRDPLTQAIVHIDLQRVSSDEAIRASVPITFVGVAPGVKDAGGVLDVLLHQIEISGPASKLPEHLEFDISKLGLNSVVHASEIKLPAGFTLVTTAEAVVLGLEPSRTATNVEAATPAAETAPAAS